MFGLGLWEIAVVVLLAVTLFPPKEIPKLARSIARAYGTVKRTAEEFRSQIMDDEDLRAPLDEVRNAYNDARWQVSKVQRDAREELRKAEQEARRAVTGKGDEAAGDLPKAPVAQVQDPTPAIARGRDEEDAATSVEADEDAGPVSGPVGFSGAPRPMRDANDPRFAVRGDDEDEDDEDEVDPFDEGDDETIAEVDPFDDGGDDGGDGADAGAPAPAETAGTSSPPRIPGPPPLGGRDKSRAV